MSAPPPVLVARHAMATRFEFVLPGDRPEALRAAAEEALDEVERIENQLSRYRPHTDIARVNAGASAAPVRVAPETFRLLEQALKLSALTDGAFDITTGPLMRAWGFVDGSGRLPDDLEREAARARVGWRWVELDPAGFTVRLARDGMSLDLGSLGKGYALDRAAELLREAGVANALLHGGTSTVVALGTPPEGEPWRVALPAGAAGMPGRTVELRDESLSVSAIWGKAFADPGGRIRGHVIDPRSGEPVTDRQLAAVAASSATVSDALSTALLVLGEAGRPVLSTAFPGIRMWLDADL